MNLIRRFSYIASAMAISGMLAGCFSYHREVSETPAVTTPPATSSSTTTTTTDNGGVEHQSTTTYGTP